MPTCKVSVSIDITFQLPMTGHAFAPAPPAPPPAPQPMPAPPATTRELPVTQFWPPGLGSHKQTSTVKHLGQSICLDGHDQGRMIPHFQVIPAPNNALLPLILFKSSRKNNFKAPMVKMNETAVGTFILANPLPMPMTSCSEPLALPLACSTMSWKNSVVVGMSWASYIISALTLAASLLLDKYLQKREDRRKSQEFYEELKAMKKIELLGGLITIEDLTAVALKSALATASSVARLAFTNEDGSFPLLAGAPFGFEITRTADGKYGGKASVTLTKGDNSAEISAAANEEGAVEGGIKITNKSKDGSKDRLGQDAEQERSVGISGSKDKDGKVVVTGEAGRKDSEGNADAGKVKYTNDPTKQESSITTEASSSDAYGTEKKVSITDSTDGKTGNTTQTVSASGKTGAGDLSGSSSETRDSTGNVVKAKQEGGATPVGSEPLKGERTTFPTEPRSPSEPPPLGLNNGEMIG